MSVSFPRRLLVPLVALALGILEDCGRVQAADPLSSEPAPAAAQPEAVVRAYRASCLKCHDTDGKGEIVRDVTPNVPDFTDDAWQASRSDAELERSILEGKGKSMPRMRDKVGSVGVGRLVAFVRAFRGGKQVVDDSEEAPTATAAPRSTGAAPGADRLAPAVQLSQPSPKDLSLREGSRNFRRSCAACHGSDGRGGEMRDTLPSIPDFTVGAWQEGRTDPQLVVSLLDGKGTGMPAFRDKVSREQARDLVVFIRSLGPSPMQTSRTPPGDFEARFQQLLAEFEDLRRRSRALSPDAAPPGHGSRTPEPPPSPPARQARRRDAQSSGAGRREAGG